MRVLALMLCALAACDNAFGLDRLHTSPLVDSASSQIDVVASNCPADYDQTLPESQSHYRIVGTLAKWIPAADDCADDLAGQTHLIVVSNQAELDALRGLASIFLPDDTWAGASAIKLGTNTMVWVTDEDTHGFIVPTVKGVLPWESDQPDEGAGAAEMRGINDPAPGNLHDEKKDSTSRYICECDGRANNEATYR
ncbi:MAG TPA: C-type lectin domain-containing protein [Kofleriaceae bacterium]|nr:C-type lectin domain-containing protein [Kofleriaceae bacterium]